MSLLLLEKKTGAASPAADRKAAPKQQTAAASAPGRQGSPAAAESAASAPTVPPMAKASVSSSSPAAPAEGADRERTAAYAGSHTSVALADWIRSCPQAAPEQTCAEIAELFRKREDVTCIAVVRGARTETSGRRREAGAGAEAAAGEPIGVVMRHRFFLMVGSLYGMPLFGDKPVTKLMDASPLVAETALSPQEIIDRAMSRDEERIYDAVLMTRGGSFAGILTVSDLLQMSRLLQQELADRQMATVRGTERMLRDIRGSIERLAGEAGASRASSLDIAKLADRGREELTEMLGLFRLWTASADRQAASVDELLARVSDTVGIAKMIAQLADQCNLLAINAQIEAARAGAQGRGFAVVAQEVRQLADQTKEQAGHIRAQLNGMAEAAAAAAAHVREGKQGADEGLRQVRRTEETFDRLWAGSSDNVQGTERLAEASGEASAMSEQTLAQIAKLAAQMLGHKIGANINGQQF